MIRPGTRRIKESWQEITFWVICCECKFKKKIGQGAEIDCGKIKPNGSHHHFDVLSRHHCHHVHRPTIASGDQLRVRPVLTLRASVSQKSLESVIATAKEKEDSIYKHLQPLGSNR